MKQVRYLVTEVVVDTAIDYTGCYYEGDYPEVETDITIKQVPLEQFIKNLPIKELTRLGLRKIKDEKK